jgi:hypothetical protein
MRTFSELETSPGCDSAPISSERNVRSWNVVRNTHVPSRARFVDVMFLFGAKFSSTRNLHAACYVVHGPIGS